jgi:dipicolinate synthase subunit B
MSEITYSTDSRFGTAGHFKKTVTDICKNEILHTIPQVEPIGPKKLTDIMLIAPCTGNTLAKLANGITDTTVCMAAKAHLRNDRPLILALATNDALSANLKNISSMLSRKNIYFVPMIQDDPQNKPHSLVANFEMLQTTLEYALMGKRVEKIIT